MNCYPLKQLYSLPPGLRCQICQHVAERLEKKGEGAEEQPLPT